MVFAARLIVSALLVSGGVLCSGADPASAEDGSAPGRGRPEPPPREVVSDLLDHAAQAFDEGAFKEASDYFRAAFKIAPSRETACNLGVAARLSGNLAEAMQALTDCLAEPLPPLAPGDEAERARRVRLRGDLEVVRQQTGSIEVTTTPGAEVVIDELARGVAPVPAIFVLPGTHAVAVRDARGVARGSVAVGAGMRASIELEPKAPSPALTVKETPTPIPAPAPVKEREGRPVVIVGSVVTGVALTASLVTFTTARIIRGEINEELWGAGYLSAHCIVSELSAECVDAVSKQNTSKALETVGLVSLFVGAVIGGSTFVYAHTSSPAPGPIVSVNSKELMLGWRGTW